MPLLPPCPHATLHPPTLASLLLPPLQASTPGQSAYDLHAVRYLDLHKSHFNRYFRGHTKEVIHLDMSPKNDTFLTSSTVSGQAVHVDAIDAVHVARCSRIAAAASSKAAMAQLCCRWPFFQRHVWEKSWCWSLQQSSLGCTQGQMHVCALSALVVL